MLRDLGSSEAGRRRPRRPSAAGRHRARRRAARRRRPVPSPPPPPRRRGTAPASRGCPRRAGERGALEAGALGALLPGGRPAPTPRPAARSPRSGRSTRCPTRRPRDTAGIIAAAASGDLDALVVGGVDPADLRGSATRGGPRAAPSSSRSSCASPPSRRRRRRAARRAAGREGRLLRQLGGSRPALRAGPDDATPSATTARSTCSPSELGHFLETRTQREIHDQFEALGPWERGPRAGASPMATAAPTPGAGSAGRPRDVAHAARRRPDAGRRAVPRRHRPAARSPALSATPPRRSAWSTATPSPSPARRARHAPRARHRRHARRRRVAPDELRGRSVRTGLGSDAGDRVTVTEGWCRMSRQLTAYGMPRRHCPAAPATENPSADFSDTPLWLSLVKAVRSSSTC